MPRIETFDAGNVALHPTETGVEATAGAARRIGAFYNQQAGAEEMLARETERLGGMTQQVGRETEQLGAEKGQAETEAGRRIGSSIAAAGDVAVKYLDSQQISQGSKAYADLLQTTTQQWNDTVKNADPNNPHVATDFMAKLDDQLENFKNNGFYTENGQKWAEAHVEALRQHMAEKTTGDMATLAGQAAMVNQQQTVNSLSATVHGDPSSIDFALASLKSSTEGMLAHSPNLSGTAAASARSEIMQKGAESIVKSAAIGYIEKTGKMPDWVTDPKYSKYVNGPELQMFERAAKTQAKANALVDKQTQVAQRQLADLQVHQGATKVISDNITFDPQTGQPIVDPKFFKQALELARNNPDAPSAAETVRTMMNWGESQQNKGAKPADDPAVKSDLMDRMFSADKPTTTLDLMKARAEGKLSDHSFEVMHGLVQELQTTPLKGDIWKDTIAAVKGELVLTNVGLPGKDITGEGNYAKWAQTFIPQYLAQSRAGTLPPNALDVKDPTSMISQSMAPFKRTVQQRAQDYLSSLGGVSPAAPGKREDVMPAIPPVDQRTPGLYSTPRGTMRWTGTGWVNP